MDAPSSQVITAGVGPIIVISACGLLCLAFYNRLAAVVTRLRAFHREHLHAQEELGQAQEKQPIDNLTVVRQRELLGMLELQTQRVTRRAELIRSTLLCLLTTIGLLALCSLALGLSMLWGPLLYVAIVTFIGGLALLIVGVCFALVEMKHALDPVEMESRFVRDVIERIDH